MAVLAAVLTGVVSGDLVLSEGWCARSDARHEGLTNGWEKTVPPQTVAAKLPLDGRTIPPNCGELWLYRQFMPSVPDGSRVFLEFARQQYLTTVWLNGERLGEHRGGCDRFHFDVTGKVRPGADNLLAMNLRCPCGAYLVDGNSAGQMPVWGGTPRVQEAPVLRVRGPAAITDVATRPDPRSGRLELDVELDARAAGPVELACEVRENSRSAVLLAMSQTVTAVQGRSVHRLVFPKPVPGFRRWSPSDPCFYRVTVRAPGEEVVAKAGFRELRVDDAGYFELNGTRIFLKSAHMCGYLPFAYNLPVELPRLQFTLLYLKTCGFNAIRYLAQPAHPELLDLCDEIGLMVYEEHPMSWLKTAGVNARELFRGSVTSVVRRDRNHPSFTAFGFMNETETVKGKLPFIEVSRELLPEVRALDPGVFCFFDSGRWDRRLDQASAANPFSDVWDGWMGDEGEGRTLEPLGKDKRPWQDLWGLGDAHQYPSHPLGRATRAKFDRILDGRRRAVFVSESGMGSAVNIVHEYLRYDQDGVFRDRDFELAKRQVKQLRGAFDRFGLYSVWPTPEAMIQASQEFSAAQRAKLTTMIRRHPEASGYSVTMAQDLGLRGEGLLETSGAFKRGTTDMLEEAMADLRFCLTASNETVYVGTPLDLEVALSDFGVLKSDRDYPVCLRVTGPKGIVWRRDLRIRPTVGADGRRIPVTKLFAGPVPTAGWTPGRYALGAEILEGAHAECGTLELTLVDPRQFGELKGRTVYTVNGVNPNIYGFLHRVGVKTIGEKKFEDVPAGATVFVGFRKLSDESRDRLAAVARSGGVVVFLQPEALASHGEEPRRLPIPSPGRIKWTSNWLYHADSVVLDSPLTTDLPSRGILDTCFFGEAWGNAGFHGTTVPDVPAVVSAYIGKGDKPGETECDFAVQLGAYRVGRGWIVLNTLRLDLGGGTPATDLLLRNMMRLQPLPAGYIPDPAPAIGELGRRFQQPNGTLVDFAGDHGEVELPTPEECRLGKPNAVGWAVPISNDAFFTGDYLVAVAKLYGKAVPARTNELAATARKLYRGLCTLQDVCGRPGCIARGTGADGKCHYASSSNDQVIPFLLGLEAFMDSPISTPEEKADCRRRLLAQLHALKSYGWGKIPGETPAFDRSAFLDGAKGTAWGRWCATTHYLYATGLLDRLEGTHHRQAGLDERLGDGKTRYDTLAGCPGLKPHENWYSAHAVLITWRLADETADARLKAAASAALKRIAETSSKTMSGWRNFRPGLAFSTNWRVQNKVWQPQASIADADKIAKSGQRDLWHQVSPCIPEEWNGIMGPFAAAWNTALAGSAAERDQVRAELKEALERIDFTHLHYAGLFFVVNACSEL